MAQEPVGCAPGRRDDNLLFDLDFRLVARDCTGHDTGRDAPLAGAGVVEFPADVGPIVHGQAQGNRRHGWNTGHEEHRRWTLSGLTHLGLHVPTDAATQLQTTGCHGQVLGHIASQESLVAAVDKVAAHRAALLALDAKTGGQHVIAHLGLAVQRQRHPGDAGVVRHCASHHDALASGYQVALNGTVDLDGAANGYQVVFDGAIDLDGTTSY